MNKISDEKKKEVMEAAKDAALETYKKTEAKALTWWERLLWIALAAIVGGASALLSGCGHSFSYKDGSAIICKDETCLYITIDQRQDLPVFEIVK